MVGALDTVPWSETTLSFAVVSENRVSDVRTNLIFQKNLVQLFYLTENIEGPFYFKGQPSSCLFNFKVSSYRVLKRFFGNCYFLHIAVMVYQLPTYFLFFGENCFIKDAVFYCGSGNHHKLSQEIFGKMQQSQITQVRLPSY